MSCFSQRKLISFLPGLLLVAWIVFCWHWLCGRDVIPFDLKLTYFQLTSWAVDCYREGVLPLWNPYFMSGFPGVCGSHIYCFYLFAMPFLALLGPLHPVWFDRVELLHILWSLGIGSYFLGRKFQLTKAACLLTALIVMFGGSASARLQHTGMIYAYGLLPWCLLLTKVVVERNNWWLVALLAICAGSMGVLGDQVAFLNCLTVAAFAAALLLKALHNKEIVLGASAGCLLVAGVVTIIVMLPQDMPPSSSFH